MNRLNTPGRRSVSVSETIDHRASAQASGHVVPRPEIAFVAGSGPDPSDETLLLLRRRLLAAAVAFWIGWTVFLADTLLHALATSYVAMHQAMLVSEIVALIVLASVIGLLWSRTRLTLTHLRVAEAVTFGTPCLLFASIFHLAVLRFPDSTQFDPIGRLIFQAMFVVVCWCGVMFMYGMFIPNSWRRAAAVIGAMAALLIALIFVERLLYPAAAEAIRGMYETWLTLILIVMAVIAILGAHTISSLRQQANAARRLGQYHLKQLLSSGGMGEVYLAEHLLLKRPCAVKLIAQGKSADASMLARFQREVRVMSELSHANNVEIYDYGRTEDGTLYYVMEYLRGLSLADLVELYGPLPAARAVYLLRQTCQALREAHARGLIHRDLKPANIFAAERGQVFDVVKLLDFGLVKPIDRTVAPQLTQEGTIAGTPHYMSPEQALGREPDARSDIYSLGAVAYFLIAGQPPFSGKPLMEVLVAHARDQALPPSKLQPDVPADLERIILRCLAKDPSDRFASVEELDLELAACEVGGLWSSSDAAQWWADRPTHSKLPTAPLPQ